MKTPTLLRGLLSFSSMTMISRVLGLARDIAINTTFGASAATDAFWVAFRIPNFMRRLFAEGSFSTAFVPVFTEYKQTRTHAELRELAACVAGVLGVVLLVVVALGLIFAPQVVTVFAPGYIGQPEELAMTTDLLRLTFPFLWCVSLVALMAGVLNSFQRFAMPALTPVILNVCMIAGALLLAPHLHTPIMALGWAILAAGIAQVLFLLPSIRRLKLLLWPRWNWRHSGVRKIMRLMGPTLLGSSVAQINLLLDTVLASLLITGSQTWLAQSVRFLELPLGVFGVALGTVILPALARRHVGTDREGFSTALDWGLRMALLVALPAMVALLILATPLVATLFQHGQFTAFDTHMTTLSILAFVSGLPAYALVKVLLPGFFARQDTRTPVKAALVALVANMVFNVAFIVLLFELWAPEPVKQLSWLAGIARVPGLHMALGIAGAISAYINCGLLWFWLHRAGVYQRQPGWVKHLARVVTACLAMAVVLGIGMAVWPHWTQVDVWTRVWHLAVLVVAGAVTYAGVMLIGGFRLHELRGPANV
ncbi:MAG TPA: murein biosynthesis integral membrane protein MurJ [Oleiagrimonas sp.]|nr:murein biosynthesis integral membrane protein MurJ [Oleiagrimonas sp.]